MAKVRRLLCGSAGHVLIQVGSEAVRVLSQTRIGLEVPSFAPSAGTTDAVPNSAADKSRFEGLGPARCGSSRSKGAGYEDPRMFQWRERAYVVMSGCAGAFRRMFLHDVGRNHTVKLWIDGVPDSSLGSVQKNWTPYVDQDRLRLVYSFGPAGATGVLEVRDEFTGECRLIRGSLDYDDTAPYIGM